MNPLDFHVLLVLANGPLYGLAIRDAVVAESDGSLTPPPGSLYRVLARLVTLHLVTEVDGGDETHPGLARRYYTLTAAGKRALAAEAGRLKVTATVAQKRLGLTRSRT